MKNNDTNMRKKYNRNLLINGFKAEFVKNLKKIFNTEDKELSFLQFLIKHSIIFVGGMIPIVIDFFKNGRFEADTCIGSLIAILLLSLCCWGAGKIKL